MARNATVLLRQNEGLARKAASQEPGLNPERGGLPRSTRLRASSRRASQGPECYAMRHALLRRVAKAWRTRQPVRSTPELRAWEPTAVYATEGILAQG
ncbi:hypothetical protein AURDEDRAFT_114933 [Auricularia subglabra TFB-10046 SS5]|nr:hypothetical protein AURDEDRAFT_114933 [Auricularia subglabra TFB-10046 SS5]